MSALRSVHSPPYYRLVSDHWFHSRGAFALIPIYHLGVRRGSAGSIAALRYPIFSTHAEAIRHLMERPNVPALLTRLSLTPADVMDLRLSLRSRTPDILAEGLTLPCVRYNATQDTFELHHHGVVLCHHPRGEVILALLRGERFEPGYVRKVLDPSYTIEEASADPDERERSKRQRAGWEARLRADREREEEEARQRRLRAPPPSDAPADLSLDDLDL